MTTLTERMDKPPPARRKNVQQRAQALIAEEIAANGTRVNMITSHPGDFNRTEVIEELGLNVTRAARILGVRRATLGKPLLFKGEDFTRIHIQAAEAES